MSWEHAAAGLLKPHPRHHVRLLCRTNRPALAMFPKTSRKRRGERPIKEPGEHRGARLTIVNAAPYVGRMTKAANEG